MAPDILATLPVDAASGQAFMYRLLSDDPRGYLLYSIGMDRLDDHGTMSDDPKRRFDAISKKQAAGVDFVINQERADN